MESTPKTSREIQFANYTSDKLVPISYLTVYIITDISPKVKAFFVLFFKNSIIYKIN